MDIACLLAPHFAVQVELRRRPELSKRPLVLATRQRTVLDASPLAHDVQPGMPLEEAMGLCKGAVVVEADMDSYRQAWSNVLDSLEERCIALEDTALGQACMDIKGLDHLYGGQAKVAVLLLNADFKESSATCPSQRRSQLLGIHVGDTVSLTGKGEGVGPLRGLYFFGDCVITAEHGRVDRRSDGQGSG